MAGMDPFTINPIDFFSAHAQYSGEWIEHIRLINGTIEKHGVPLAKIVKHSPNPSALCVQLLFLLIDCKVACIPKNERITLARFLYDLLKHQRRLDPFSLNRKNILLSPKEVDRFMSTTKFYTANENVARLLGKVYLSGSHLANGLYSDNYTDFGIEIHGPYDVSHLFGKNHSLVITDLVNLKPTLLYPHAANHLASSIRVARILENTLIKFDMASCHFTYDGDPILGLRKYAFWMNDKPIHSLKKISSVQEETGNCAAFQWEFLERQNHEKTKKILLLQRCFLFKEMCDYLNLDWKPTKEMLQAVKNKPANAGKRYIPKTLKQQIPFWRKLFDPRVDFYPMK